MLNSSVQCFLQDMYGQQTWVVIAERAGLPNHNLRSIFAHAGEDTEAIISAAVTQLGKPRNVLLEDLGTYLVTHPNMASVRRLLRFGGATFVDFLYSLDELPARARLALPDLDLPDIRIEAENAQVFSIRVTHWKPGFSYVLAGILRAISDDYGTLVVLDYVGRENGVERLSILLADPEYTSGNDFNLGLSA